MGSTLLERVGTGVDRVHDYECGRHTIRVCVHPSMSVVTPVPSPPLVPVSSGYSCRDWRGLVRTRPSGLDNRVEQDLDNMTESV